MKRFKLFTVITVQSFSRYRQIFWEFPCHVLLSVCLILINLRHTFIA